MCGSAAVSECASVAAVACLLRHMQELSVPLGRWLRAFPSTGALHPFEASLLDLTVGIATYTSVLAKADALRKGLQEVRPVLSASAGQTAAVRQPRGDVM